MKNIYIMYDKVADMFFDPFYVKNNAVALRDLKYLVNEKNENMFNVNSSDKEIYLIGTFDPNTGKVNLLEQKQLLIKLDDLKDEQK